MQFKTVSFHHHISTSFRLRTIACLSAFERISQSTWWSPMRGRRFSRLFSCSRHSSEFSNFILLSLKTRDLFKEIFFFLKKAGFWAKNSGSISLNCMLYTHGSYAHLSPSLSLSLSLIFGVVSENPWKMSENLQLLLGIYFFSHILPSELFRYWVWLFFMLIWHKISNILGFRLRYFLMHCLIVEECWERNENWNNNRWVCLISSVLSFSRGFLLSNHFSTSGVGWIFISLYWVLYDSVYGVTDKYILILSFSDSGFWLFWFGMVDCWIVCL